MRPQHILLALLVVFVWGVNFVVIKVGLRQMSPLGLGVIRFALAALPWIFVFERPKAPWSLIVLYGLLNFALQFGLMFTSMKLGMGAGLTSLIMQLQVFFTIGFSVLVLSEKPTAWQMIGALLAFGGIGVVAAHVGGEVTWIGLFLLLLAAMAWGAGNIVSRKISLSAGSSNVLGLVAWGSLFAVPPLLIVALIADPQGLASSVEHFDWVSAGAVAYLVYLSTLFAFGVWSWLMGVYPVATVAPFTLLVPVFAFLSSAVLLGEPFESWKLTASALVVAGLLVNLFGARLAKLRAA